MVPRVQARMWVIRAERIGANDSSHTSVAQNGHACHVGSLGLFLGVEGSFHASSDGFRVGG